MYINMFVISVFSQLTGNVSLLIIHKLEKIKTSYLITFNIYIIFLIKQKKIIGVHSLIQKVMGTLICKQI